MYLVLEYRVDSVGVESVYFVLGYRMDSAGRSVCVPCFGAVLGFKTMVLKARIKVSLSSRCPNCLHYKELGITILVQYVT